MFELQWIILDIRRNSWYVVFFNVQAASPNISSKENGQLRSSDRGNWATTAWDSVNASFDANVSAAAAEAELVALSPRSRSLKEVFHSLSTGRTVMSRNALEKWDYVSRSTERGLIPQHQAKKCWTQSPLKVAACRINR